MGFVTREVHRAFLRCLLLVRFIYEGKPHRLAINSARFLFQIILALSACMTMYIIIWILYINSSRFSMGTTFSIEVVMVVDNALFELLNAALSIGLIVAAHTVSCPNRRGPLYRGANPHSALGIAKRLHSRFILYSKHDESFKKPPLW